jgi:micrococcal nuclease
VPRFARPALLLAFLTACADPGATPPVEIPTPSPTEFPAGSAATVVGVTDGDTFTVRRGGREEKVRLIGIDAPEVGWYGGAAECFGAESGRFLRGELTGARVRLETDQERHDEHGRLLAYAYVGSRMMNLTLVRRGYAEARLYPPNARHQQRLDEAEAGARASGAGLWSACGR